MKDILRYLKVKESSPDLELQIAEMQKLVNEKITPQYKYALVGIEQVDKGIRILNTNIILTGELAKNHFIDDSKIAIILATLTLQSELLLKRTFARSASLGVILDAVLTDTIEKYLDKVEIELKSKLGGDKKPRISCGYGDLPLELEKDLFKLVEGEQLGVSINDSFMKSPNKSVIALIGIK